MVMDVAACRRLEAQDQLVPAADHLGVDLLVLKFSMAVTPISKKLPGLGNE